MAEIYASHTDELGEVASRLLKAAGNRKVWALKGKMGAGKTTLIQAVCEKLGSTDNVSSPTFALVNEYRDGSGNPLFHFDLYRLEDIGEVYDIGFEEYIDSGFNCLIEWPEMVEELLPEDCFWVEIDEVDGRRSYRFN